MKKSALYPPAPLAAKLGKTRHNEKAHPHTTARGATTGKIAKPPLATMVSASTVVTPLLRSTGVGGDEFEKVHAKIDSYDVEPMPIHV